MIALALLAKKSYHDIKCLNRMHFCGVDSYALNRQYLQSDNYDHSSGNFHRDPHPGNSLVRHFAQTNQRLAHWFSHRHVHIDGGATIPDTVAYPVLFSY